VRVKRQKGPSAKKIVKKDHVSVAARLARRHVSRAAWAKSGKPLPPPPNVGMLDLAQVARDTCRLARRAATETWSFFTKIFAGGLF
jgi:hypothetical protein